MEENKKFIDWHTHTTYSDGMDSAEAIVRKSKLLGIESLAITDHDSLGGFWDALHSGATDFGLQLVPGVEISTEIYHILGLGIDPTNSEFNNFLAKVRDLQEKICEQRIEKLQAAGYPITLERLKSLYPESRIGKFNIFMALLNDRECREKLEHDYPSIEPGDLFNKVLGKQGLAGQVPKLHYVTSREAIEQIHKAGGLAIVAHPFKDAHTPRALDLLLVEGLDGLEIQPNYGKRNDSFAEYAKGKNLVVTYGSDYHGAFNQRALLRRGDNHLDTAQVLEGRCVYG